METMMRRNASSRSSFALAPSRKILRLARKSGRLPVGDAINLFDRLIGCPFHFCKVLPKSSGSIGSPRAYLVYFHLRVAFDLLLQSVVCRRKGIVIIEGAHRDVLG